MSTIFNGRLVYHIGFIAWILPVTFNIFGGLLSWLGLGGFAIHKQHTLEIHLLAGMLILTGLAQSILYQHQSALALNGRWLWVTGLFFLGLMLFIMQPFEVYTGIRHPELVNIDMAKMDLMATAFIALTSGQLLMLKDILTRRQRP